MKDTLLTLILYALCFYVLFAFTTPAFRLGTIYKTAFHWIDAKDMQDLEASKIYPYGFVILENDTYKGMPSDTFFQRRERIFDSIWQVEDTLLRHFYTNDTLFWKNWYDTHENLDKEGLIYYLSYLPSRSSMFYLPSLFSLPKSYQFSPSYLSYKSSQVSFSYLPGLLYESYLLYRSDMQDKSTILNLSILSSYEEYKQRHTLHIATFDKYGFNKSKDSIKLINDSKDTFTAYRTVLPYSVEKAVYSVKHARLYLQKKIYILHWQAVLSYALLLSLLLYFVPFLILKTNLILILIYSILTAFCIGVLQAIDITFLILPILSLIWLAFLASNKKNRSGFNLAVNSLFMGLVFVLVFVLSVLFDENTRIMPTNHAFYGIQVLGILGAVLTTYVRTLPKG